MAFRSDTRKIYGIINDIDKPVGKYGKLYMDFANQRSEGQWDRTKQSFLIHSAIVGDIIPEIVVTENGVTGIRPNTIFDGRQRISTFYTYVNDAFALSKTIPDVTITVAETDENGEAVLDEEGMPKEKEVTIKIAGKKFSKLPEVIQSRILDYDISVRISYNCTEEDISRQMWKLNNGKAMTAAQKAITRLGITLATEMSKIAHNDFFDERIVMTKAQIKNSENMRRVLQSLILYTGKHYNKLDNKDMSKLAEEFANDWTQADLDSLNDLFIMLNNMLPDNEIAQPHLTTNNIPILIMNVDKYYSMAEDGDITESQYRDFLKYWFEEGINSPWYTQYEGKSISNRGDIEGRIQTMETALLMFLQGEKLPTEEEVFGKAEQTEDAAEEGIFVFGEKGTNYGVAEEGTVAFEPSIMNHTEKAAQQITLDDDTLNVSDVVLENIRELSEDYFNGNDILALRCMGETDLLNPDRHDFSNNALKAYSSYYMQNLNENPVINCMCAMDAISSVEELKGHMLTDEYNLPILVRIHFENVKTQIGEALFISWLRKLRDPEYVNSISDGITSFISQCSKDKLPWHKNVICNKFSLLRNDFLQFIKNKNIKGGNVE